MIDYKIVVEAISFYEKHGYKYIDVPWSVSKEAMLITCPKLFTEKDVLECNPSMFVTSGEQSFLEMILDDKLHEGKYCCAVPCFPSSVNSKDGLYFLDYFKVELISYYELGQHSFDLRRLFFVEEMANLCRSFMQNYRNENIQLVKNIDNELYHNSGTEYSCDLEISEKNFKLGSYSLKYSNQQKRCSNQNNQIGYWVYGPGVVLPRITTENVNVNN